MVKEKENTEVTYSYNYCYEDKFLQEDIEERRLYINYPIDVEIIDNIVYHILRYNRMDKDIDIDKRKPIILYINTPGGAITDGYGLIDTIKLSKTPVHTVNLATCYSMGFLIFIAGEKRYSMPNATFLCHDGSSFIYDSTSKVKDRMEFETGQMEKRTKEYILSNTSITEKLYNKKYRDEWYMYPEEAKDNGVVTHIVGVDCALDEII